MEKTELLKEDYKNILVFLNRADLKGSESTTHAVLLQKLAAIYDNMDKEKEVPLKKE